MPVQKKWRLALLAVMLFTMLALPAVCEEASVIVRVEEQYGASGSFVWYPVLSLSSGETSPVLERVNSAILEKARIPEYLRLLSGIREGSAGLRMDVQWALAPSGSYLSILFSARGKMLSSRPSQVYYPMTFDLITGEEIGFDRLFSDPEKARSFIEEYLEEEIAPSLSSYLENSALLPIPFDRFYLDGCGHLLFLYENSQLSFLSGDSGAVAFRYSELREVLDTSPDGAPYALLRFPEQYSASAEAFQSALRESVQQGTLPGLGADICLGDSLEEVLDRHHPAADSGFYPGGAYYETEDAFLRGVLFLTDEREEEITGILTGRIDLFGLETGVTTLPEVLLLLDTSPIAQLPLSAAAADMYRVCPGTAAVFSAGQHYLTLYADEEDVVQYVRLSIEP